MTQRGTLRVRVGAPGTLGGISAFAICKQSLHQKSRWRHKLDGKPTVRAMIVPCCQEDVDGLEGAPAECICSGCC